MIIALLVVFTAGAMSADGGVVNALDEILVIGTVDVEFAEISSGMKAELPSGFDQSGESNFAGIPIADSGLIVHSSAITLAEACALSEPVCVERLAETACLKSPAPFLLRLLKVPISLFA